MQQFLATKQIKWSNILAKAPWFGAIYERLIKTVKRCLKKTLKNSKVTVNELNTLLAEIECLINNRPLTYQSSDDFGKVLTLSYLITGRRLDLLADLNETELNVEDDPSRTLITKRQRHSTKVIETLVEEVEHGLSYKPT